MKTALITGITGQDGSFLAELLLRKGYKVVGVVRRSSTETNERIVHMNGEITLVQADLLDQSSLIDAIRRHEPDEVYNLAAQSFVPTSWSQPVYTGEVTGLGALRVLEALREVWPQAHFYQACSSEMFGKVRETPQDELTPFHPRSPYGVAKVYAHYITVNYRESYKMHASSGILFNHESERRGLEFVTRKITHHVAKQKLGLTVKPLELGNLDAKRDWGYAKDYVYAMWLMLQQDEPDDYVIATGETRTVRDFVEAAYRAAGADGFTWRGEGVEETMLKPSCVEFGSMQDDLLVQVNPEFFRPAEVQLLQGNPKKAQKQLHWVPMTSFEDMVEIMVKEDLRLLSS